MKKIWHTQNEQPRDGYVLGDIDGRLVTVSLFCDGREITSEVRPSVGKCRRWCYVDDLMKMK